MLSRADRTKLKSVKMQNATVRPSFDRIIFVISLYYCKTRWQKCVKILNHEIESLRSNFFKHFTLNNIDFNLFLWLN